MRRATLGGLLGLAVMGAPFVVFTACNVCGVEFLGQNNPGKCADTAKTADAGDAQPRAVITSTVTGLPGSQPPPTPTVAPVATATCGGPTDAGPEPDASICNTMICAPAVDEEYVAGSIPSPIGGYIPNGTYALTALNNYGSGTTGPTGYVLQDSFKYEGAMFDEVTTAGSIDAGIGAPTRISGTYATSGTTITWTSVCNSGGAPVGYTLYGGQFRTFVGNREYIYGLQE